MQSSRPLRAKLPATAMLSFAAVVTLTGCVGMIHSIETPDAGDTNDASRDVARDAVGVDVSMPRDVPVTPIDVPMGTDVPTTHPDVPPPQPDVVMIVDTGPAPCSGGTGLSAPIPGCMPVTPASTGDPHEDCVRRINQFRCECQQLPPLARWTAGEACADMMAQYDAMHAGMPHAGFLAGICPGGYGENECPGWPSVPATVSGCLQQMWDEGPGDFYGPPAHGHYLNMSSTSFTMVACGFYEGSGGVWAVQNFQ